MLSGWCNWLCWNTNTQNSMLKDSNSHSWTGYILLDSQTLQNLITHKQVFAFLGSVQPRGPNTFHVHAQEFSCFMEADTNWIKQKMNITISHTLFTIFQKNIKFKYSSVVQLTRYHWSDHLESLKLLLCRSTLLLFTCCSSHFTYRINKSVQSSDF